MLTRFSQWISQAANQPITEDDLLRWDAAGFRVEVVRGRIVPVGGLAADEERLVNAAGVLHAEVITNIYDILKPFAKQHGLGKVYPEGLHFILAEDAEGVRGSRIPDVCFIRLDRFGEDFDPRRPFHGAPDLAAEVVSPSETQEGIAAKVTDYLNAGTEEVWVVYPAIKEVYRYQRRDPSTIRVYRNDDRFTAETLFPGLEIAVAAFFLLDFGLPE